MSYIILESIDIESLLNAHKQLQVALTMAHSELEQVGAIQRFECCYELAWKTMKRILAHQGIEVNSPRVAFREAYAEGLIVSVEQWFDFLKWRNQSVHTYNSALLYELFEILPLFEKELVAFIERIKVL